MLFLDAALSNLFWLYSRARARLIYESADVLSEGLGRSCDEAWERWEQAAQINPLSRQSIYLTACTIVLFMFSCGAFLIPGVTNQSLQPH